MDKATVLHQQFALGPMFTLGHQAYRGVTLEKLVSKTIIKNSNSGGLVVMVVVVVVVLVVVVVIVVVVVVV